jgi:toluene monooxygenase system protein E
MSRTVPPLKTYSHLEGQRRVPTEYEVVTTRLLYYPQRGFEIDVPVRAWYDRYQRGGRLVCTDWELFRDPRETTYTTYTALQSRQEVHLDGVARTWQSAEHDPAAAAARRATINQVMAPLRYPLHGFQMLAAYVGQMAPAGRIAIAALFQAADEVRRVHCIAQRMGEILWADPGAPAHSRIEWQSLEVWQPLRRAVETALVAFDWGEALVAVNLCLKPLVEGLLLTELGRLARQRQDYLLGEMLASLDQDGRWHRSWSGALIRLLLEDSPDNAVALADFLARWAPAALAAIRGAVPLVGEGGLAAAAAAEASWRQWLGTLGLTAP